MEPFPTPTEDEEEEDWLQPQPGGQTAPVTRSGAGRGRVVVHLDLDCFYAQVEMLRNPGLRDKPLGVQQKSIVVTCNYEARKLGVKKLMSVKDAKEKCPQLLLVHGEDLTPYRDMSYKVTELLTEFCPLVERLGLDENFVDVTEMAEKRLKQLQQSGCWKLSVSGHVYNNQTLNWHDPSHLSLVVGSQLAGELREALVARLGLTGCAGVATSKLLSKLVSGTFKPNQQTILLPESCQHLLHSLESIQKVPGIGYKTAQQLAMLGVKKVKELQSFPTALLEKELGFSTAQRIQKLSWGEDESPVTPSGPPQSFSDEDSFQKCSSEGEVREKLEELLPNLLDRVSKDGRQPHTIRLMVRRFSCSHKWLPRESRQCPLPPHLLHKLGRENSKLVPSLVDVLMKLFHKMIDVELPFHLTLLGVCFSNLKELPSSKKSSIGFYLKQSSAPPGSAKRGWEDVSQGEGSASCNQKCSRPETTSSRVETQPLASLSFRRKDPSPLEAESKPSALQLPEASSEDQACSKKAGIGLPPHVDSKTFSELPVEVQEELLAEWKKQEAVAKKVVAKSPGKAKARKRRKEIAPGVSQPNSLLRYWKPQ